MLKIIIIFTISYSIAQDINISKTKNNNLILKSNNCQVLMKQRDAICKLKKKINPSFKSAVKSKCKKSRKGLYSLKVSSCLPKIIEENYFEKLHAIGANCWGTAMNLNGLTKVPRFVWKSEVNYWHESPLCRKLKVGEKKKPGDIINIYGPEHLFSDSDLEKGKIFVQSLYPNKYQKGTKRGLSGFHSLFHSETYISDELTYGKNSPSELEEFKFRNISKVYTRSYDVRCQENQTLSPHLREYNNKPKYISGSKCDYFSIVYRCQNIMKYFEEQSLDYLDLKLLKEIKKGQNIQKKLFNIQKGRIVHIKNMSLLLNISDFKAKEALRSLKNNIHTKNSEMLTVYKYFTYQGIRKTLEQSKLAEATEPL